LLYDLPDRLTAFHYPKYNWENGTGQKEQKENGILHHVVIIGGGFGGLYAAKALGRAPLQVTLIDKRNFHLFQPLLYQVATGGISPGDIASPLRAVLNRQMNTQVLAAEVVDLRPDQKKVILKDEELTYDTLVVATGALTYYFGNDWDKAAPGLKTVEDAIEMRRRIFLAFEAAERESNPQKQQASMTFVVIGGGPTGVELAGALGELSKNTLKNDFRKIQPAEAKILLLEGQERILPTYPPDLSAKAAVALKKLGVTVQTNTFVTSIQGDTVTLKHQEQEEVLHSRTILWAAGVQASPMGRVLAERTGVELDRMGRVMVAPDLSLPEYSDILVIGDLAHYAYQTGEPLLGVAPVAMQQGRYAADLIRARLKQKELPPFHYVDKGNLAVIGRNAAVADIRGLHLSGFLAWFIWLFVHIQYLIEFGNKIVVMFQWAWTYFTRKRGARLITGPNPFPLMSAEQGLPEREELVETEEQ
jgi:NADH dehydrogenase